MPLRFFLSLCSLFVEPQSPSALRALIWATPSA
jgi:hypothetical protein